MRSDSDPKNAFYDPTIPPNPITTPFRFFVFPALAIPKIKTVKPAEARRVPPFQHLSPEPTYRYVRGSHRFPSVRGRFFSERPCCDKKNTYHRGCYISKKNQNGSSGQQKRDSESSSQKKCAPKRATKQGLPEKRQGSALTQSAFFVSIYEKNKKQPLSRKSSVKVARPLPPPSVAIATPEFV